MALIPDQGTLVALGIERWLLRDRHINRPSKELEKLNKTITECRLCECNSNHIPLTGFGRAINVRLLVVAEYAQNDDKVFADKAFKLFGNMIYALGLNAEEVFVTNTIKCVDTKNHPQAAISCRKHLMAQIDIIKPQAIMCLGALAAQTVLKSESTITELRQNLHEVEGFPLVATYHPEYLLKKPTRKKLVWQNLLALRKVL